MFGVNWEINIITLNELTSAWSGKASLMPLPPGSAVLCSLHPKAERGAGRAAGSPVQEAAREQPPAHLFPSRAHICSCGLVCGVLLRCSAWGAWAPSPAAGGSPGPPGLEAAAVPGAAHRLHPSSSLGARLWVSG